MNSAARVKTRRPLAKATVNGFHDYIDPYLDRLDLYWIRFLGVIPPILS